MITSAPIGAGALQSQIASMTRCIVHRGPDDDGIWTDAEGRVGLGFRRLAILDLSPTGHQPMVSRSGRFTIVFNGEVYNYLELRAALAGGDFRGGSDTEVILAAFERWGIAEAVRRFIGMFAMAVWDAQLRQLTLIRDRIGKKPLYVFHKPGTLSFGSELKALAGSPHFDRSIDEVALSEYLRYLFIPAPRTIYRHVSKLSPGHLLTIEDINAPLPPSRAYWRLEDVARQGRLDPIDADDAGAVQQLRELLQDAVKLRMRSDVPMGALLSGGVDSTTTVALMQSLSDRPVRTFAIGFPGTAHDEGAAAAAVATALGTAHTALSVSGSDALAVVPRLPDIFDEPLADPSQIPTYLVCKLARSEVTVALTGDGGDEIFGGYERYVQGERLITRLAATPRALRMIAGAGISAAPSQTWDRAYHMVQPLLDRSGRHRLAGLKMRKLGELLQQESPAAMYHSLLSVGWQNPDTVQRIGHSARPSINEFLAAHESLPLLDRMMLTDQVTYLPDDLLAKVDRASMAVSLEVRVPLLDHRVVEFGWRLPRRFKIRDGRGKWILRELLHTLIDRRLVDRPKTGFTVPIAQWLRGPLRTWGEDLLFASKVDEHFDQVHLRRRWQQLHAGADEVALSLWTVVMFKAWSNRWLS